MGGVRSCTRSAVVLCSSSQLKLVFMFRIIFDEITIRIRNVQLLKRNNFNYIIHNNIGSIDKLHIQNVYIHFMNI